MGEVKRYRMLDPDIYDNITRADLAHIDAVRASDYDAEVKAHGETRKAEDLYKLLYESEFKRNNQRNEWQQAALNAQAERDELAATVERGRALCFENPAVNQRILRALAPQRVERPDTPRCEACGNRGQSFRLHPDAHGFGKCIERRQHRQRGADRTLDMNHWPSYPYWDRRQQERRKASC